MVTRAQMIQIKETIDGSQNAMTYQEIADAIGVDKKVVTKTLIERIYGMDNYPTDKIKVGRVGLTKNPVFTSKNTIQLSAKHLADSGIEVGERFKVVVSGRAGAKKITLTTEGIDEAYVTMMELRAAS